MKRPLYSLVLEDNNIFNGGYDYSNTKWKEIPHKKIKRVFYHIPKGDTICLSGYDRYCHLVEVAMDLNGTNKNVSKVEYVYIMGQKDNKVSCYKINLKNYEDITHKIYNIDDDFIKKISMSSWK